MHKIHFINLLIVTFVIACSDDENETIPQTNQNPGSFSVQPTEITDSSSLLIWNPAIDPDGDTVSYTVFLEENEIQSQINTTQFLLENLSEQTTYSGKVVATDDTSGVSESNFSFTTISSSNQIAIAWQKSLGGSQNDMAYKAIQTNDQGYIIAGSTRSNDGDVSLNNGNTDCWIAKLDASGNLQWETSLGGSNNETVHDIAQTTDGGYIIGAFSSSTDGDVEGNNGMRDFWIIKLDNSGNISWKTRAGGTSDDILEAIIETSDGAFVAVGFTSSESFDVSGQSDAWVVKIDSSGEFLWETNLGGTQRDLAFAIDETSDQGYIVAGYTETIINKRDMWIFKLNQDGGLEWEKTYAGSENEEAISIQQTSDQGYIIGGYSRSNDGDIGENKGDRDAIIIKTDQAGNILWKKIIGGSKSEGINHIQQTNDGGYIAAGGSNSDDIDIENNNGAFDFWVLRLHSDGEIIWQQSLGGEGDDFAFSIEETDDGGFISAGYWYTNITGNGEGTTGDFNYWVIKLE